MRPEEMVALGQNFTNQKQIVQESKAKKEEEIVEFVEELITLMTSITEKERDNLREDNIFSWGKKRLLGTQESLYLGNFITNSNNKEKQEISNYIITGRGLEVKLIYENESDKPCFNEENLKKIEEGLIKHNIHWSYIQYGRNYITFTYQFLEKSEKTPDQLEKAFRLYGRKRAELIRKIEKNTKLITIPLEELSQEIGEAFIQLLTHIKSGINIKSLESFEKELNETLELRKKKIVLTPGNLLNSIFEDKGSEGEYILNDRGLILRSHEVLKQVLTNGEMTLAIINRYLESKNIKITIGRNNKGDFAIIEYGYQEKKEEEQNPIDRSFLELINVYKSNKKASEEELTQNRDNYIRGIFNLLGRAMDKITREGCQIKHTNEKIGNEERIQNLGNYNIQTETKSSEFNFDPETGEIDFILYYPNKEIDIVGKLISYDTLSAFLQYGITITMEYDHYNYRSFMSTIVGGHVRIRCNMGLSKTDKGTARTLKQGVKN